MERVVDGLGKLTAFGAKHEINVIVENHGGLSSDGAWLAEVMKKVNNPRCGTLPDFGNFGSYDRYKGVDELMPFAKGVSAKSHDFDDKGEETHTNYHKMLDIVAKHTVKPLQVLVVGVKFGEVAECVWPFPVDRRIGVEILENRIP